MQKSIPMTVDILIKTSDQKTKYSIEECTADIFLGDGIKHYQIGSDISLRLESGNEFKATIKDIKFWPSTSNSAFVVEIFV